MGNGVIPRTEQAEVLQETPSHCVSEMGRIWELMLGVVWSPLKNTYTAELWFTAAFDFVKGHSCFVHWSYLLKVKINWESCQSSSKPWMWYCTPRVFSHQLWIFTEILMSAFYCGNEGKIKCVSCLLLDILSQRTTKGFAVGDTRRLTRIGQACRIGWLHASWLFLPWRAEGGRESWEKEISDHPVVLACELLILLQWSRICSGIGLDCLSFIQMTLETRSEDAGWEGNWFISTYQSSPFFRTISTSYRCYFFLHLIEMGAFPPYLGGQRSLQRQQGFGGICPFLFG